MRLSRWIATSFLLTVGSWANAGIIVDINESGTDVVAVFSGTIDLNAVNFVGNTGTGSGVVPNLGLVSFGGAEDRYQLTLSTSDGAFGSGSTTIASSSNGDAMYFYALNSALILPANYVSNSNLSGSMTFQNTDFATLGINSGVYNYTFGQAGGASDFIRINIGQAQVPAPATVALFGFGLAALAYRRRQRA